LTVLWIDGDRQLRADALVTQIAQPAHGQAGGHANAKLTIARISQRLVLSGAPVVVAHYHDISRVRGAKTGRTGIIAQIRN
jgi:hypothetical protein